MPVWIQTFCLVPISTNHRRGFSLAGCDTGNERVTVHSCKLPNFTAKISKQVPLIGSQIFSDPRTFTIKVRIQHVSVLSLYITCIFQEADRERLTTMNRGVQEWGSEIFFALDHNETLNISQPPDCLS
ncbi:ribulose-phosphate 3-epimerase [Platysternon megacephalum]|uniref:Ribulose-phosphate 3-epimerase n=1 Tax=Platysternon megacephalum TaxID=55544 RepID=A0A4D9DEU5_9SAUR|nr:ribulose-phosphate 3-epimerase [Platysternon megacephalum]